MIRENPPKRNNNRQKNGRESGYRRDRKRRKNNIDTVNNTVDVHSGQQEGNQAVKRASAR